MYISLLKPYCFVGLAEMTHYMLLTELWCYCFVCHAFHSDMKGSAVKKGREHYFEGALRKLK